MKNIPPFEKSELLQFEERYLVDTEECKGDPIKTLEYINYLIELAKNEISEDRHLIEQIKLTAFQNGSKSKKNVEYQRYCNSPADLEELIEHEKKYIEFLKLKRQSISKETRILRDNEKFEILRILGLFNSDGWNSIQNRSDQNRILAELLGINPDTAKNLINSLVKKGNSNYRLKQSEREELEERIKSMQKGV
jgi:hypothetical protein